MTVKYFEYCLYSYYFQARNAFEFICYRVYFYFNYNILLLFCLSVCVFVIIVRQR